MKLKDFIETLNDSEHVEITNCNRTMFKGTKKELEYCQLVDRLEGYKVNSSVKEILRENQKVLVEVILE